MAPTHLSQLFSRYLATVATEEERQELFRLALERDNRAELDRLLKDFVEGEGEGLLELARDNVEPLYQNILAKAGVSISSETSGKLRSIPVFRRTWFKVSAAAAILISLSFGTYFLIKNQKPAEPSVAVTPLKADVAPGGNKAILTLSNGSKIILDSAHNGTLAQQGNTNIIKTDSGKLAYNLSEKPANNTNTSNNPNPSEISYNTLSTPRGGQFQLTLPDGTKVWLNAASSITYPTAFVGRERKVEITGEAYFEVAHNPSKPFLVLVNDIKVEVLGTHFNVNAYTDEKSINTTLLEGSVKVTSGIYTQMIKPGQQLQVEGGQMNVNKNVDIDQVVAWKNGNFDFESADLKTILRQFSRWYDVEVIYEGVISDKKFFAIVSRNTSLKNMLESLQDFQLKYRIEGKKLYIKQN